MVAGLLTDFKCLNATFISAVKCSAVICYWPQVNNRQTFVSINMLWVSFT